MIEGVELVAHNTLVFAEVEKDSLGDNSALKSELSFAVVQLYASILRYLSTARAYYSQRTMSECKILSTPVVSLIFEQSDFSRAFSTMLVLRLLYWIKSSRVPKRPIRLLIGWSTKVCNSSQHSFKGSVLTGIRREHQPQCH